MLPCDRWWWWFAGLVGVFAVQRGAAFYDLNFFINSTWIAFCFQNARRRPPAKDPKRRKREIIYIWRHLVVVESAYISCCSPFSLVLVLVWMFHQLISMWCSRKPVFYSHFVFQTFVLWLIFSYSALSCRFLFACLLSSSSCLEKNAHEKKVLERNLAR